MSKPREATDAGWPADPRDATTEKFSVRPSDYGESFDPTTPTAVAPQRRDPDESSRTQTAALKLRLSIIIAELALGLVITAGILILLLMFVRRDGGASRNLVTDDVPPPAVVTETRDGGPASVKRLAVSFNIRKLQDGVLLAPYTAARGETFSLGDKFTLVFEPSHAGHLIVFSGGPQKSGSESFNLLFPTPSVNGGSTAVAGGKSIETALNTVTGQPGKEILWIVWTSRPVSELEEVRMLAFDTSGEVRDDSKSAWLKSFLLSNLSRGSAKSETAPDQKTLIKGSGDIIVHMSELWPPLGHSQ